MTHTTVERYLMAIRDELLGLKKSEASCAVGRLLETLDAEDQAALVNVLQDKSISSSAIAHVLEKYGFVMSGRTVNRHRNLGTDKNRCSCR